MKVCKGCYDAAHIGSAGIKRRILPLFLACAILLTGCEIGKDGEELISERTDDNLTWGMEPVFEYEIPAERPVVLVDRQGYLEKSTKTAFFEAKTAPTTFSVLEKESDKVVYTGEVIQKENVGYIGTFTDLQDPGEYYIKSDVAGCSYYFTIGDDSFHRTAEALKGKLLESQHLLDKETDTKEICEMLSYLMTGYEIYPYLYEELWNEDASAVAGEENNMQSGKAFFDVLQVDTNWLLTMQDSTTGGVYSGIVPSTGSRAGQSTETSDAQILKEVSAESTACFTAVMAKYAYRYQLYDMNYATTCLKAAAKAWKYLESMDAEKTAAEKDSVEKTAAGQDMIWKRFFAASELYRASNDARYHTYIKNNQDAILINQEDIYGWMGKYTYLYTRRRVDKGICTQMMNRFLEEAERIAGESRQKPYLVGSEEVDDILTDMTIMGIVDYVITNHEYSTVIENHIHYMLGRNEMSTDHSQNLSAKDSARLLFMLSAVTGEKDLIE